MSVRATGALKSSCMRFDSMEPTIATHSEVIVDHSHYKQNQPTRWEVVVFTLDSDDDAGTSPRQFMKRIVGLPGETIHLTGEGLKIDEKLLSPPSKIREHFSSFKSFPQYKFGVEPYRIPHDAVFVIGDNPDIYISDSREHGAVPLRNLKGRVLASISTTPVN